MQKTLQNNFHIKGRMKVSVYDTTSPEANALEEKIQAHLAKAWYPKHRDHYLELIEQMKRLFLKREYVCDNLITTVGRGVIAQRLANTTTYTGIINYGALGTDATAATNGDTTLGTEVFRKTVASASISSNIAFIDFFYSKSDTNGTYEEFGTFIDGTASADTGQMFTHLITGGWIKTSSESMTVACQYTIT